MKKVIRFIVTMSVVLITTISCDETMTDTHLNWYRGNKNGEKCNYFLFFPTKEDNIPVFSMSFLDEDGYWIYCDCGKFFVAKAPVDSTLVTLGEVNSDDGLKWLNRNQIEILKKETIDKINYYTLPKKNVWVDGAKYFFMEFKTKDGNWIKYTNDSLYIHRVDSYNVCIVIKRSEGGIDWFKKNKIHMCIENDGSHFHLTKKKDYVYFRRSDIKCAQEAKKHLPQYLLK